MLSREEIIVYVSSKRLVKIGLVFRGKSSLTPCDDFHDNIDLHLEELSGIIESNHGTKQLCLACREYGLEFLHLLECPTFMSKKAFKRAQSPRIQDGNKFLDTRATFDLTCAACRMFHSMTSKISRKDGAVSIIHCCPYARFLRPRMISFFKPFNSANQGLCEARRAAGLTVTQGSYFEMRGGLLLPVRRENESGYLPRGRILEPEVNFDVVRSWVKLCEMGHGDQCSHRDLKIEGLRVIDCYTKTVIEAPANCCYIALSYVWGSGSADAAPGFDWHSLPPLILDSVTCTLRLQCRYLWVDRYCIPQENFTLKHQQIRQMHTIYRHAWITIIAACCQDASSGLVGISVPRDTRFSAKIGDGEFAVASHPWYVKERLQKSKWSTRGWTFQEGLLSSRRLVFSDAEVYLQCNAPTNCLCEFESHDMQSLSTRNSTLCLEEAFPINLLPSNAFRVWDCQTCQQSSRSSLSLRLDLRLEHGVKRLD